MTTYAAGYINAVNGSDQVEGFGTYWIDYAKTGDTIFIGDLPYKIIAIDDNHLLTLYGAYTGESTDQATYSIENVEKPGRYYRFNTTTLEWEASAPTPIIQELVVSIGFKKLSFTWSILDSVYGDVGYETEIWSSLTNDFATATLHSATIDKYYEAIDLVPVPNFYWFRAAYTPDAIIGVKLASGSQTPIAVQTIDIEPSATNEFNFGRSADVVTANPLALTSVASFVIANTSLTEELPCSVQVNSLQVYSAGLKQTRWAFYNITDSVFITDTAILTAIEELPVLSTCFGVPVNTTKTVALLWWAEDTTVSLHYRDFRLMAVKR